MLRLVTMTALAALCAGSCHSVTPGGGDDALEVTPPGGDAPRLYRAGTVSTGNAERDASFAPDGSLFAFTLLDGRRGTIVLVDAQGASIAPFSGTDSDIEPFFDPRGGALWFASDRAHPNDATREDWNIWRVERMGDDWGDPRIVRGLDEPGNEFYPTVALDGTVAFTSKRAGGQGDEDIWLAGPEGTGWRIENPGAAVNSAGPEFNALLTPDGGMLFFSSVRPDEPRDLGGGDLYVSVGPDWLPAVPLVRCNSSALDYCPAMTPDGRRLVFTSRRRLEPMHGGDESLAELRARLGGPGNGQDDLWWAPMPTAAELEGGEAARGQ